MELKEMHCSPILEGTKPLDESKIQTYYKQLPLGWEVIGNKKLMKEFPFENFKRGMAFAQELGILAEEEQHHPDICISFTKVVVELSTHDIGGLSDNDFIMAARIEEL